MYSFVPLKDSVEDPCGHSLINFTTFLPENHMSDDTDRNGIFLGFEIMAQLSHYSTLALLIIMHPLFVPGRWIISRQGNYHK